MNRRYYIKSVLVAFGIGATSFATLEWFRHNKPFDFGHLEAKREVLAEIVEVIIPTTLTPGAKDCGVHKYIINVLKFCMSKNEQELFFNGIEKLEADAFNYFGIPFIKCSKSEKQTIVRKLADGTGFNSNLLNKIRKKIIGVPFFTQLRNLTVEGYCLSKLGATEGLTYDYIPGQFKACIPLQAKQRSWATK